MRSLRVRDDDAVELMDSPDCDPVRLERTYASFPVVNAVVSGWRQIYRRDIRPLLHVDQPRTLLDIGAGGGDLARSLTTWARQDGLRLHVTAIDPDARAHTYALAQPAQPGLTFRRAFSSELVGEGARFDIVVSNHVLHHLTARELGGLLFDSERLCRQVVLHADIERSRLGYLGFGLATWPFFRDSYIRPDGLTSIRRSFTVDELRAVLTVAGLSRWWVTREVPSRYLLRYSTGGTGA
ncbi:class I SAM-dependent methyltransferase [Glaciibacter psychrotolerans]|uniref:2-polyprenyl-3-methyl-5-hydroxy-6-metoxy-1, 4-benzoquinol methylase n=1 Tax=Glaciibacter psychrotolerans TaxID=670054 RepID=A0A7Z0EB52_9MICO|nr:class I SAM-dependent methyltransferase [Leifsonia psychrotolerans]NYJ18360.1 2-polyprenyl-3-methyl-5-hydroxy-6-metoxy-1,4-benzoquinol methylase [Leifsonia psychrotolerans]